MAKKDKPIVAVGAVTEEDLAFERELQRMAEETPPGLDDNGQEVRVRQERGENEMLSDHMEGIKPASTISQLRDQVFYAKQSQCNSIEATPELIRYFTRPHFPTDDAPYFMYDSVKVWRPGTFLLHKDNESMSVEGRIAFKKNLEGKKKTEGKT